AGDDTTGHGTIDAPMASIQGLLTLIGTLKPGDIVYVDTGVYKLTTNIVFTSANSGSSDTQRIVIQGATDPGKVTTFDRQNRSGGFYGFEFKGADYVTLQNLRIIGGEWGVVLDDNQS